MTHASKGLDQEHQVKAAFVANFIKFIEWPDLGRPGSKFIVGIYGAEDFDRPVEEALAGRSISGHPIVVQELHSDGDIKQCRMVISGASSEDRVDRIARICSESGAVLVGESDDFVRYGGVIGFLMISSQVRFDVSLEAAKRARVTVSAKLLTLAHEVYKEGRE